MGIAWKDAKAAGALALCLSLASCAPPSDEAWLRFLGFRDASGDTLSSVTGTLGDGASTTATAAFENASMIVGRDDTAGGVTVTGAHVSYRRNGAGPPAADLPLSLYVPGKATVTLPEFPVVSAATKAWLVAAGATPPVELTATVTFSAKSDDGKHLETSGGIAVLLTLHAPGTKVCSDNCSASGACSDHDGVNCLAGPDPVDGSVICNDGWRDSSVQYHCD